FTSYGFQFPVNTAVDLRCKPVLANSNRTAPYSHHKSKTYSVKRLICGKMYSNFPPNVPFCLVLSHFTTPRVNWLEKKNWVPYVMHGTLNGLRYCIVRFNTGLGIGLTWIPTDSTAVTAPVNTFAAMLEGPEQIPRELHAWALKKYSPTSVSP